MSRYQKTRFTGVFAQSSTNKKHQGRADVCWYIVYQQSGKRKWEKVGWLSEGYTAALAQKVRAERIRTDRQHNEIMGGDLSFAQAWMLAWERHISHLGRAYNDQKIFQTHLAPRFADHPLTTITTEELVVLKNDLQSQNKAPATLRNIIGLVSRIYNLMIRWGIYQGDNPAVKVTIPKIDNRRSRFLSRKEAQTLLEALKSRSEYVFWLATMSLYTGMRAGEIMTLRGEHVNLDNGHVRVVDTKNKKDRTVYLPKAVIDIIRDLSPKPGELLFPRPKGGSGRGVSHVFGRVVRDLGLNDGLSDPRDHVVFHTLRHTYASWMVMQGLTLYQVGNLLGHTTPQMSQRYAHLAPETQRTAVAALENFISDEQI